MFQITIRDMEKEGSIVGNLSAERYVCVSQNGNQLSKSFSSTDFVDQLGLLNLSIQIVCQEINKISAPVSLAQKVRGGDKNE